MNSPDTASMVRMVRDAASIMALEQRADGSFPPGHNGPHHDPETPVRNTAYWLYTLSFLTSRGCTEFAVPAHRAADYLCSQPARPMSAAFHCRTDPTKDLCNGLVGQVWVLESLLYASQALGREALFSCAREVFYLHAWDDHHCGWRSLNVDGSYGPLNATFNQQLWMAAIAAQINEPESLRRAEQYLTRVLPGAVTYQDGVIYHDSYATRQIGLRESPAQGGTQTLKRIRRRFRMKEKRQRSLGYHAFNLAALPPLMRAFPQDGFWQSRPFQRMTDAHQQSSFQGEIDNKFSFAYNPVGYEYNYFLAAIQRDLDPGLLEKQNALYQIADGRISLTAPSEDHHTTVARLYELCRLLDTLEPNAGQTTAYAAR